MPLSRECLIESISAEVLVALFEGGGGSGNYGHKGRPGMRGGSLPTRAGSILAYIAKSQAGKIRFPKLSSKLFGAARKARNLEVVASGSPKKMLKRLANILIGRTIARRFYR